MQRRESQNPGHLELVVKAILACVIPLLAVSSASAQVEQDRPSGAPDNSRPTYINGEPVYRVGGGVSAPRPVYTPDPEYSEEARKAKYQGTCVLWLVVGTDGRTRDVRIARSLGMGLDEKSIEAVRSWRFEPATKGAAPVAVQLNVETSFRMSDSGIPATLEPLAASGTQSAQFPGKNAVAYPLVVDIRFVTGQQAKKGYVVNAEATIHEGEQQRKAIISCGPKDCFLLRSGKYPARRLSATEMALLGRDDEKGKWHPVKFYVAPIKSTGD